MVAVYIGIIIQIVENGPLSLSALGFFFTFGSFFVAAIFHPQEWTNVFYIIIYLAMIPSVYLLMTMYAIFNMDDISWGTRETNDEKKAEEEDVEENENQKKTGFVAAIQSLLFKNRNTLSFFKKNYSEQWQQEAYMENSQHILEKLRNIERTVNIIEESKTPPKVEQKQDDMINNGKKRWKTAMKLLKATRLMKVLDDAYWIRNRSNHERCKALNDAEEKDLDHAENMFWRDLMREYLQPIKNITDEETIKEDKKGLKKLKNSAALGYLLLNTMWVTAIFTLEANVDVLGIKWPLGAIGPTIVFNPDNIEMNTLIIVTYEYYTLDPIGFVFVIAFICVIIFQCIGMLIHVTETLEQIVSHVNIFTAAEENDKKGKQKSVPNSQLFFDDMREKYEKRIEKEKERNPDNGQNNAMYEQNSERIQDIENLKAELKDLSMVEQKPTMSEKVKEMLPK